MPPPLPASARPANFSPLASSTPSSEDPSDGPITSSYLASQASSAAASVGKPTSRRSPRLSSAEPGSPRKHSQSTAARSSAAGTPGDKRRASRLSSARAESTDEDDEASEDDVVEKEASEEGTPGPATAIDDDGGPEEGSFSQSSAPLSDLAQPLSSALASLASPLKPALTLLASPLKRASHVLSSELERARAVLDGAEEAVEGAVEGAGFKVVEVAHRVEDRATRAGRAVEARGRQAKASVEDGVEQIFVSLPRRALAAFKQATVDQPAFWQTVALLALEAGWLYFTLAPATLKTASFPPRGPLLAPIDRRSDFAHLYDAAGAADRPAAAAPWLTVVYPSPTWPANPIGLLSALLFWTLSTVGLPLLLAPFLSSPPTDRALVFWLLRAALLALVHAGWRNEGFGSGSGRAGLVGSLLGIGLGVARGLGEAKVGGARRR